MKILNNFFFGRDKISFVDYLFFYGPLTLGLIILLFVIIPIKIQNGW